MAKEVTINELEQAIAAGDKVVDVREDWEFTDGHVPNAKHIALNSVPENLNEFSKDSTTWIICQSGGRSMTAANYLEGQGYNVVSVAGGTGAWIQAGKGVSMEASK
jgi:rhodanese-related sulfurtransferase